jgi:hypothetical protein
MIDKYGALLHTKWEEGTCGTINGHWAEDNSIYTIDCPGQLRESLIQMQNQLCDLYQKWDKDSRDLQKFEQLMNKVFP